MNPAAASGIAFLQADGMARPDLIAQHDRCWVTFAVSELPTDLLDALPEGGKLLAPVGPPPPTPQRYLRYTREAGQIRETDLGFPVVFIPRRGLISLAHDP